MKWVFCKQSLLAFTAVFMGQHLLAQTDFSDAWEDFFSYNHVRSMLVQEENLYAICDNAAFIYNRANGQMQKLSSVQGLSGKETSTLFYHAPTERFVIGYVSGLLEIIEPNGRITVASDIERLNISGQKAINHISADQNLLYLSTDFGIVVYDIANLQFGDTYFIDAGSNAIVVNQTAIDRQTIYAATDKGIYVADLGDPALVDADSWLQPEGDLRGSFSSVELFQSEVITAKGSALYKVTGLSSLELIRQAGSRIIDLKASDQHISLTLAREAQVLDNAFNLVFRALPDSEFDFSLEGAYADNNKLYLATTAYGILEADFNFSGYREIHPDGPSSNQVFSITAQNNQLWVVYGGYNAAFTPLGKRLGYSHYNGSALDEKPWKNAAYDPDFPAADLVQVTIDPEQENRVYMSSWHSGMLVVENDQPQSLWDDSNSGLEDLSPPGSSYSSIRVNGAAFDNTGNLWVANAWVPKRLKKRSPDGNWKGYDLSSLITNPAFGLTELVIDRNGSIWIGSRRNGALVYNETGDRKRALKTEATKGSLPDLNVRALAVDRNNRVWIGTQKGLVVFSGTNTLFEADIYDAAPVIIEDDGVAKKLLGDQPVNSIAIDGAENKWFGTDTGGVLGTNPQGGQTLYVFNKDNSPLPSNRILKVQADKSNGKVYFATDKGIVAFNSGVVPFGESLSDVYAYPNPVRKQHETVTIDGRKGSHLPKGTNVKILDVAGRLVYETNVEAGQALQGGKVVWNKTNLGGKKVASGVYLVLLTSPDKSETSSTKIAVIN